VDLLVSGISYCNTITAIKGGYEWFAERILRRILEAITLASPVLHTITCESMLMHLQYVLSATCQPKRQKVLCHHETTKYPIVSPRRTRNCILGIHLNVLDCSCRESIGTRHISTQLWRNMYQMPNVCGWTLDVFWIFTH